MSPKPFDRMMIAVELESNPKIGRLTDRQFRTLISGVWALAAKATPRGYLTVAGEPATASDVAHQARVPVATAKATLALLKRMEMIEHDDDLGLDFVHDWWTMNPDPKNDPSNAERQARYRERRRNASNGASNGVVTPPEVEVEEEVEELHPPTLTSKVGVA
jgi:hypothetical protein